VEKIEEKKQWFNTGTLLIWFTTTVLAVVVSIITSDTRTEVLGERLKNHIHISENHWESEAEQCDTFVPRTELMVRLKGIEDKLDALACKVDKLSTRIGSLVFPSILPEKIEVLDKENEEDKGGEEIGN